MWGHLTYTLLQQSHLCPLPLLQQPIYWQHDHAMHLYPLPHAVVVADTSPQAQQSHQGCTMFNPVSNQVDQAGKSLCAAVSPRQEVVGFLRFEV